MAHKDPEAAKAYAAAYRAAHREKAKQTAADWRLANPGRAAEMAKRWREENPERAREKQQAWRAANSDKVREAQRAWRARTNYNEKRKQRGENTRQQLKLYGLTEECFARLLADQGGACAICRQQDPGMKNASRLYVDHCHTTNRVRGLLCRACNSMLGCALDRPDLLRLGAAYLEREDDDRSALCGEGRDILEP